MIKNNIDKINFIINYDKGRILELRRNHIMKYIVILFGGESMTKIVRIIDRRRSAIEDLLLISTKLKRKYCVKGVSYNTPCIYYHTRPKGWMDQNLIFLQYFNEG